MNDDDAALLRWLAGLAGLLGVAWGASLGVRPALAFGLAVLGVLLALWLYPRLALRQLSVARTMAGAACEEDAVRVRFEVTNGSPLPLLALEVVDRFAPDKVPVRRAVVFPALGPRRRVEAHYDGRCDTRRGDYEIGPEVLRVRDPLGLFVAESTGGTPAPLVVYPTIEPLPAGALTGASRAPAPTGGAIREAGEGGVVLGVREYRAGDALRRIHWPTTARRGRLSIIEHERQVARGVVLFLDLARVTLRGLGRQSTLDVCVRALAALAAHAIGRGDRVALHARGGLAGSGGLGHLELPLAGGRPQLERILDTLARVKPDGEQPLGALVHERWGALGAGTIVWLPVADPEQDGEAAAELVSQLRARGCQPRVLLLDPAGFRRIFGPPRAGVSLADIADACAARGALVYTLGSGEALAERLAEPWAGRRQVRITPEMLA
jgi:uncharacterized protein (DUF58 family)